MNYFEEKEGVLFCEETDLREIAQAVGTPFYVYSHRTLVRHCRAIDDAFADFDHLTCYAMKANSNLAVLQVVAQEGLGADIVSGGELFRARTAGIPADRIVYSGVGKTVDEIKYALKEKIKCLNIESEAELEVVSDVAVEMGVKAPVALRVNPDVDPKTHPKISTGLKSAKFGIPHSRTVAVYQRADMLPGIEVVGIDCHIGSQLTSVDPFVEAAKRLLGLIVKIRAEGISISHVDIGGGLGIIYEDEQPPTPAEWGEAVGAVFANADLTIINEPGRSIVGNTAALITRTLYLKSNESKRFVVVDAAMNDLARPSMYDSYHEIRPVVRSGRGTIVADVVGPICETGDVMAREREIEEPEAGDLLAIMSAGAYGFAMASTYNSRPLIAEVMVRGDRWQIVRERQTWDEMIQGEKALT